MFFLIDQLQSLPIEIAKSAKHITMDFNILLKANLKIGTLNSGKLTNDKESKVMTIFQLDLWARCWTSWLGAGPLD